MRQKEKGKVKGPAWAEVPSHPVADVVAAPLVKDS